MYIADSGQPELLASVYAECQAGALTYGIYWYDAFAGGSSGFGPWAPSAGDKVNITINVNLTPNVFWTDLTSRKSYSITAAVVGNPNNVVCGTAMENGMPPWNALLPSVPFGKAHFKDCQATVNGVTAGIGGWGSYSFEYVCLGSTGAYVNVPLASPGKLSKTENFVVKYLAMGP